jgi:integrase
MVVFENGERFPILVSDTGVPIFDPTVYAVSELRGRNLASATMVQAIRGIMLLHGFLDRCSIDLNTRLTAGRYLDIGEIEGLVAACKKPLPAAFASEANSHTNKVLSLEKARKSSPKSHPAVAPATTAIRLVYIRDYLRWVFTRHLLYMESSSQRSDLIELGRIVDDAIKARTPRTSGRNQVNQRLGLSLEAQDLLLSLIVANNQSNPWCGDHPRARNALIVKFLLKTGTRRSELLGLRIEDIGFRRNEVLISRRPDDETDPRLDEPNTKTRDRIVPIDAELAVELRQYITMRRQFPKARKHGFLLVSNGSGKPLSKSAFNRIFQTLQQASPLLAQLTPHVLRHTFNDNLSDEFDRNKVSAEREIQIRNRLNGWSERSHMAANYTKRHIQRKAAESILSMQRKLTLHKGKDE